MRIELVKAHAFGPFQSQSLQLGPGMNVIFGPNEAGKSSWHAALYAGVCGMRRGRGGADKAANDFALRHRPWDTVDWRVAVLLRLEDGRRVELDHDLVHRTALAIDADVGRDYTSQVIYDGGVDGSVWLGLNRKVFLATACIRQADLLAVLDDPNVLQEHLQRAADTGGVDATAATALQTLELFSKQRIGLTKANSRGPLRQALNQLKSSRENLEAARERHAMFLSLAAQTEEASSLASRSERQVHLVEARVSHEEAKRWGTKAKRVHEILNRHPHGRPASALRDEEIARRVAVAVSEWESKPSIPELTGPSAVELAQELASLPNEPHGDVEIDPTVKDAVATYRVQDASLRRHVDERPPVPELVETGGMSEQEIHELARELDLPLPAIDTGLKGAVEQATLELERTPKRRVSLVALAFGTGAVSLGLLSLYISIPLLATGLFLVAAILMYIGWPRGNEAIRLQMALNLREAEAALGAQYYAAEAVNQRRTAASSRAKAFGLDPTSGSLLKLVDQIARARQEEERWQEWNERGRRLTEQLNRAIEEARKALYRRGVQDTRDVEVALDAYEKACHQRREQLNAAGRRAGLHQQVQTRVRLEQARQETEQKVKQATVGLWAAGERCGIEAAGEDALLTALEEWQADRVQRGMALAAATDEWNALQALLDGRTLAELENDAMRYSAAATNLAMDFSTEELAQITLDEDVEQQLRCLRTAASSAAQARDQLRGRVKQQAKGAMGVPEAEEELALAEGNLKRVQELASLIEMTKTFLLKAQDEVHRSVAPILKATVERRLATVTGDRYHEVLITPETMDVQVRSPNGPWRRATLLSHGTAEQIYLLLRLALVEHFTKAGEVSPLILDDITTQSDAQRTLAILQTLRDLSTERQIILFSQEAQVQEWATVNLTAEPHRLIQLPASLASA